MKAITNGKIVLKDKVLSNGTILFDNGKIIDVGENVTCPADAQVIDAQGMFVGPGFVDIHIHGDGTACRWNCGPEEVATHHLRHGSTTMLATMSYGQTKESLIEITTKIQELLDAGKLPNVYCVSFEGPYINPERGANSQAFARPAPDPDEYTRLYEICRGKIGQWMYAPEMDVDGKFGDFLREKNITAAVGHTNASPAQIRNAVDKGATIATHLFDAMGCWMGNDSWKITGTIQDSAAVGCLICPEMIYEIIPDSKGVHVKKANIQLTYQLAGPDRIAIITDCTNCGYDPSSYPPDHFRSTVDINYNHLQELSGSRLTMDLAFRNFKNHSGAPITDLFRMASTTPARAIGADHLVGSIESGKEANFVFLDDDLYLQKVVFRGEIL